MISGKRSGCSLALAALLGAVAGLSCSHLKIDRTLRMSSLDWPTYAGSVTRAGEAQQSIVPPLTVAWRNDLTGGVGDGSPVVVDSLVFVGTLRGEIHAFSAVDGRRLGWIGLGDAINGSPCVSGNMVYVGISNSDESLIAFDLRKGGPLWKQKFGDIEISPLLDGERLYVGNLAGEFFSVARSDGATVWKFRIPDDSKLKGIRSTPALAGSTVLFGCDDGFVYALDTADGSQRWRFDTGDPVFASVSVSGGTAFAGSVKGNIYAIDVATGNQLWRASPGSGFRGGVACTDELVLVPTIGGTLFALERANGKTRWERDLGGVLNSAPVVSGRFAYLGTLRKILYGVDLTDGSIVAQEVMEGRIKTSPAVAFGRLYVATDDRMVTALEGAK